MELFEIQLDQDAVDEALKQINFFTNIPKHIRVVAFAFNSSFNANIVGVNHENKDYAEVSSKKTNNNNFSHIIDSINTIQNNRINIPSLN